MKMDRKTKRALHEKSNEKPSQPKPTPPSGIQFASVIEQINEGFVALDAQMNYLYINKRGSEILGRAPEDLIGKNYWDEFPDDKHTPFGQAYLRALETRAPIEIEDFYAPQGLWFENRIYPFEDGLSIFFNDITARKEIENAVHRTQEEWNDFVENASVGMHWVGADGTIMWANRFELEMLGYTAEEYIGHHIAEFHADASVIEDILKRLTLGETLNEYPARMLRNDGSIRDVLINSNVYWEDGKFAHTRCFTRDITERKRAEATMRESEERFQTLANGSPVLLWVNGLEGCEFVNREYLDFLGLAAQTDVHGYDWSGFVHPYDREAYLAVYLRAFERQAVFSAEFRFRRYDGEYRWMRSEATPRRAVDGSFLGYVGASIDITVRKRAELALQKSEHQLRLITDAMPALISYIDNEYRYLFVNRTYREWFSYENEEVIGKTAMEVLGAAAFETLHPHMEAALAGKTEIFETETPYQRGGTRFIRATYTPDIAADGVVHGFFVLVLDITERKQAEEALAEYARQQAALYQLTDQLQHTKSLEDIFNAALNAILSALQCNRASILLFDKENVMRFVAWRGLSDDYRKVTDGHSPWKADEKNPLPISMNDVRTADLSDSLRTVIEKEGIGSLAFIPLVFEGKLIGKFMTYFNEPHIFSEDEIELSLTIARQFAAGIERKRDENALRTSEERFRLATRAAQMFSWEFDLLGQTSTVADNFAEAMGFSAGLIPQNKENILQTLIHPDDAQRIFSILTQTIEDRTDLRLAQFRILNPENNQTVWIEVNGKVLYDSHGNPERMFGVAQNITKRKEDEQQIAEKARLLDLSSDAIIVRDAHDRVKYWNRGAERVYGWRSEEVLGKVTHEILQTEHPEPLGKIVDSLLRDGHWSGELIHIRRDGERLVTFSRWVMERDVQGQIASIMETNTDITERKHVEDLLRSERELIERLFETMPVMVSMYDPTTNSMRLNAQFEQLIGWKTEEVTVLSLLEKLYPDAEYRDSVLQRMAAAGKNEWVEVQVHTRDGRTLDSLWSNISIMNDDQLVTGIAIGIDITERKQVENRLALLAEVSELTRKIEDADDLMYAVSNAVGEHLHVRRCLFNETDLERDLEIVHRDYHHGVDSEAGVHKISDYSSVTSAEMAAGRTVVNYDSKLDPRTAQDYEKTYALSGERSYVAVPLMRENRWVGTLWVSDDLPRQWSPGEVSLLETIAERTWTVIEKLRINTALRESESRYRFIVENTSDGIWQIKLTEPMPISLAEDEQLEWYYKHAVIHQCNLELAHMYGYNSVEEVVGLQMQVVMPRDNPVNLELARQFIRSGYRLVDAESREMGTDGREMVFLNNMVGVIEGGKLTGEWGTNRDITERKRAEEERDQLLLQEQGLRVSAEQAKVEAEQAKEEAERELAERRMAEAALGEWVDAPLFRESRPAWMRYGLAVALTAVALFLRVALQPYTGDSFQLTTLYGVIAFSVWFGGIGPALLSAVLGYLGAAWLIIEPLHIITLDVKNVTGLGLFMLSNTVIIALGQEVRRAQRHAHQSARVAVERQHQVESQLREKQLVEDSLRQSESLYRGIARSIPGGGVYVVDKDFRYIVSEGPVNEAFGLTREVLEGHTVSEVFSREPAERMEARLRKNFSGETVDFETEHNGRYYWTQQAPMPDDVGKVDNAIIMTIDITERKQVEEALKESERKFSLIFHKLPFAAALSRPIDGTLADINEAFERVFGFTRQEALDKTSLELGINPDSENRAVMLATLQEQGSVRDLEVELFTKPLGARIFLLNLDLVGIGGEQYILQTAQDITERKQAEEALRRSEERFVRFMQHLPGLAWIKDVDGRYVYANAAAEKAFNTPREDLYGRTDEEVFPANVAAQFKRHDDLALMDEKGVQVTETLEHEDGVLHYSLVNKFPIPGPDGSAALIGGTAFDITERKQAEEALRESEARLRAVFDGTYEYIGLLAPDGTLLEANRASLEFDNNTYEQVVGRPFWETPWWSYTPGAPDALRDSIRRAAGGEFIRYEAPLNRRSGETVIFDFSLHPIRDEQGKIVFLVPEGRNITDRKQSEEALRESEERFRAILSQATAGIVRKDVEGRFIFVNEAFCNMLGYTEAELLGKTFWEFTHPDDLEENKRLYDRAMTQGIPFKMEKRLLHKDGSILWVDVSVSPVMDTTGNPQSAVVIEVDITKRKKAEEALHQLNLQLESRVQRRTVELQSANQSLRDEIAERLRVEDALHESRKRLQILSQRLVDVQEEERRAIARELHDRVGQSLSALNINLVILDNQISNHVPEEVSARLDDSMKLVAETITLVRDVMSDLRPSVLDDYGLEAALQSHIHTFKSRYDVQVEFMKPSQPISRLTASIEMTFLRIAQEALINVARHAKASQVSVSLQQDNEIVRLVVEDNGMGIQSWQEANRPGSHGLTIMRERAEAFGGDLKVSSVPGTGTKVEASIPIETGAQKNIQNERLA